MTGFSKFTSQCLFQSRCRDSLIRKPESSSILEILPSFSPVAGIHLLESKALQNLTDHLGCCFSPVAGIHLLESLEKLFAPYMAGCFSPVARIHLLESINAEIAQLLSLEFQSRCRDSLIRKNGAVIALQILDEVSVPLPGFTY